MCIRDRFKLDRIKNNPLWKASAPARKCMHFIIRQKEDVYKRQTTAILKGDEFTMHMKVNVYEDLPAPIFALSIKNIDVYKRQTHL